MPANDAVPVSYSEQYDSMRLPAVLFNETQKERVMWAVQNALACGLSLNIYTHDVTKAAQRVAQLLQTSAVQVLDMIAAAQDAKRSTWTNSTA